VLARELGMRHNLRAPADGLERRPAEPLRLGELAGMAARTLVLLRHPERLDRVRAFRATRVRLPPQPGRRAALQRAIRQVGQPYIWGGEWPSAGSPVDPQAAGGFDCSGLAWFALGNLGRTTADQMAWVPSWPRIATRYLRPGDLVFFGPRGRRSRPGTITHMGLYLGGGLMVQSSGSRAGVSVTPLATYWPEGLVWGRRPAAGVV
jgi:cell wall-associated NlpC family hydrolase